MTEFNTADIDTDATDARTRALKLLAAQTDHTVEELDALDGDDLRELADNLDFPASTLSRLKLLEAQVDRVYGPEERSTQNVADGDLEVGGFFTSQETDDDSPEPSSPLGTNSNAAPASGPVGTPMGGGPGEHPVHGYAYEAAEADGITLGELSEDEREAVLTELATRTEFTLEELREMDPETIESLLETFGDLFDLEDLEARLDDVQQQSRDDDVFVDGYFAARDDDEHPTGNSDDDVEVGGYFTGQEEGS